MNGPKQNKISFSLDSKLSLNKNRVDVDQFTSFAEKNSPMYNKAVSNLYTQERQYDNRAVFDTKGNRFHYKDGILYRNDEPVMETGGDSYFTREKIDTRLYDTYDKDNDGNELYSTLADGVISYHTPNGDYNFTISDPLSAIIDCRARIVNGAPIIVYVLAQSTGTYEVVYLRDDVIYQRSNIERLQQSVLQSSLVLDPDGTTTSNAKTDQGTAAITTSFITDNVADERNLGFVNPIIQISNPLDKVYIVSILSNHGGRLKTSELQFINIVENNETFYDKVEWNTDVSTIQLAQSESQSITFKVKLTHESTTTTVYCYPKSSGWAQWDKDHADEQGKWYLNSKSDGVNEWLLNEIVFDPGYDTSEMEFVQNVQGTYQQSESSFITYTKWQQWQAITLKDAIEVTATPTEPYPNTDISWTYTPMLKTVHTGKPTYNMPELKGESIAELINAALPEGRSFFQFNNKVTVPYNELEPQKFTNITTGEEVDIDETWQLRAADDTFPESNTAAARLAASVWIERPTDDWVINPDDVIMTIHALVDVVDTEAISETVPGTYAPTFNDTTANRETMVFEQTYVADKATVADLFGEVWWNTGNPYKQQGTAQLNYNETPAKYFTTVNITQFPNFQSLAYYETSSATAFTTVKYEQETENWSYSLIRDDYLTWAKDEPRVWEANMETEQVFEFSYIGNSTQYEDDFLFGGFVNQVDVHYVNDYIDETDKTTQSVRYDQKADVSWAKEWQWTVEQSVTQIYTPDVFLDNGTAVSVGYIPNRTVLPISNILTLQAQVTDIDANKLSFTSIGYYNTLFTETERVVLDTSVDINTNYYRIQFNLGTRSFALNNTYINIMYDSADTDVYCDAGTLSADTTVSSGYVNAHFYNNQGSITGLYGKWRSLINSNGLVSGLSYGDEYYIGTLLTEWNSISETKYLYYTDKLIGYLSTDGNWYETKINEGDGDINIVFDRYIIINTNGYWNCYDIERHKQLHYATDFNNRVIPGVSMKKHGDGNYVTIAKNNTNGYELSQYFVSGVNSLYEVSQTAVTSIQISPQPYLDLVTGYESFPWAKSPSKYTPQYIEVFYGTSTDATAATYQYSTILYESTKVQIKDSSLVDLNAPVAISAYTQYSPNILTEFIHTYNNKDLIRNGTFAYPIMYNETTPIFTYSSAKQIANVDAIFVIQSQFYGIIDGRIVSITYDDFSIIGIEAIIDITGMKYLGYLPTSAFFWSPADRCIYTFTGDANLDINMEASKIAEVYATYYNTMTESIFITTNAGVYIIAGKQMWHLDDVNIDNIYFLNKGTFIIETKAEDKYKTIEYSYEPDLLDEPVKRRVILESKYNGPGDGKVANTDCVQVVLITDEPEAGDITFSCSTFTDVGFKSESKTMTIKKSDWDELNKAIVIDYYPKYQTGQGFKWRIESDFAIARVTQSSTLKAENTSTKRGI